MTGSTDNGIITLNGTQPNATVEQYLKYDGTTFTVGNASGNFFQAGNDTIIIGLTPSLYATKGTVIGVGTTNIFSVATASYTSMFYEYYIKNGTNLRAGNIVAVWTGSSIQFTETSTMDIGNTTTGVNAFTFSAVLSTPNAVLQGISSLTNWEIRTIIRAI